jgi:hypothetical protein
MLLYEDIITGDEMISDAFPMYALLSESWHSNTNLSKKTRKNVDDIAFEVDCQMITLKDGDVDIGTCPIERKRASLIYLIL